jgi:DNA modification methylase
MTTPYYADEHVTLYHGDCLAMLDELAADVLVSDVPYGNDYKSNRPRRALPRSIEGDKDTTARDAVLDWWAPRPAIIFGTWRIPRPADTRALLVWDTKGALGMGALDLPWKPAHQEMYVLGSGFTGRRGSDVITVAPVQSLGYNGRTHPHEKPVDLMLRLIDKCPPGVVLDPFAGTGATLVAAKRLGRRAVGVEIDRAYCDVIVRRLAQGVLDLGHPA